MDAVLHWFQLDECLQIIALAVLFSVIGRQMDTFNPSTERFARRASAAAFVAYGGLAFARWRPYDATTTLDLALRGALAAGLAYGVACVAYHPLAAIAGIARRLCAKTPRAVHIRDVSPRPAPRATPRDDAKAREWEQLRRTAVADARGEAARFYEEHADLLSEELPPALFRSQLAARFPDEMPTGAIAASLEAMIGGMLPLIAAARLKRRTEQEEAQKRTDAEQRETLAREEAQRTRLTPERVIAWHAAEEARLKEHLPPGNALTVRLIQLAERFDELMKTTLDEAQP